MLHPWKLPHSCFTRKESKELALCLCADSFISLTERQRVSGASPLYPLENTCEASEPQKVAVCQPSGRGLLQIFFIHTLLHWNLVLNTASLSPSPGFICCQWQTSEAHIRHSVLTRFSSTKTALSHNHPWSFRFPTVAPPKSNCLAPHFWHHSLLPWQVPPIQHDDFPARRRGCTERETTFV